MRWVRTLAFAAAAAVSAASIASAQTGFPTKAVHLFVPYPAGGAVDILARTLGDELSKNWGQPVIVENRPGAGGVVASQALAYLGAGRLHADRGRQRPRHQSVPLSELPYDTFKDFTPISLLASSPNILLVRADSPYKTLADLLAQARAKPGSLSYGMAGNGTSTHLAGELLKNLAHVDIVAIPYKGGGPAMNDLLGGQIPMSFNNGPESRAEPERRHRSRARRHDCQARAVPARRSDHGGGGRRRLRYRRVVGAGGTGRDVGDYRRAIIERFRRSTEGASGEGPAQHARRGADRQLAKRIRCRDPCRLRKMGSYHQSRGHEGRMTPRIN